MATIKERLAAVEALFPIETPNGWDRLTWVKAIESIYTAGYCHAIFDSDTWKQDPKSVVDFGITRIRENSQIVK